MKPTQCTITGLWFVTGYLTGRKYWGSTPRDCEETHNYIFTDNLGFVPIA